MEYKEVNTKSEYIELLESLKLETKDLSNKFPEILIYSALYNQIVDIHKNIKNKVILSEDEIYNRYSIGSIAVKNFDCQNDIFGRKLQDVFGGLFDYYQMPE